MTPRKYEIDGVEMRPKDDFHTFTIHVIRYQRKSNQILTLLHIPKAIAEYLCLKHRDLVEVAIRKVEKEAK